MQLIAGEVFRQFFYFYHQLTVDKNFVQLFILSLEALRIVSHHHFEKAPQDRTCAHDSVITEAHGNLKLISSNLVFTRWQEHNLHGIVNNFLNYGGKLSLSYTVCPFNKLDLVLIVRARACIRRKEEVERFSNIYKILGFILIEPERGFT